MKDFTEIAFCRAAFERWVYRQGEAEKTPEEWAWEAFEYAYRMGRHWEKQVWLERGVERLAEVLREVQKDEGRH